MWNTALLYLLICYFHGTEAVIKHRPGSIASQQGYVYIVIEKNILKGDADIKKMYRKLCAVSH